MSLSGTNTVPVANPMRTVLPSHGLATVKSVLSGDTVVLTGRAPPGQKAPVVIFTFERVTAPRYVDEICMSIFSLYAEVTVIY